MDYIEQTRKEISEEFNKLSLIDNSTEFFKSPYGNYTLEVSEYGPRKRGNFSRGIVRQADSDHIVCEIKRNYSGFWHAWVSHRNGEEYLLCGEDYQGYNVITLPSGRNDFYLHEDALKGMGFCWVVVHASLDGTILAVEGCYWGDLYEIVFFDFSDPANLPFPEFERNYCKEVIGWIDENTFGYITQTDSGEAEKQTFSRPNMSA